MPQIERATEDRGPDVVTGSARAMLVERKRLTREIERNAGSTTRERMNRRVAEVKRDELDSNLGVIKRHMNRVTGNG